MGMSTGSSEEDAPMSNINTTPLVDVMLVLLIIFLITIPVALDKIEVKLPNRAYQSTITKAENVLLSVRGEADGSCGIYWGLSRVNSQRLVDLGAAKFLNETKRLESIGADLADPDNYPEVHIRADDKTPYRCIGGAISMMQSAGFIRVGFISEPVGKG